MRDFLCDGTPGGQRLKFLTLTDEYPRESLATEAGTSLTSLDVQRVLARVLVDRPEEFSL